MCMKAQTEEICGDYSGEDTPVPIPNTEVKLLSADDTWRATSRESKTLPLISSIRSYGQAVKTPPFHGGNPGSIPGRITIIAEQQKCCSSLFKGA